MRHSLAITLAAIALSACATQAPTPVPAPTTTPAPAAAAAPAKPQAKAPQCWSGDASAFFDVGTKTTVSGVAVECKATSDGKAAQWMGSKSH